MSSFKRIPKDFVKHSDDTFHINDRFSSDAQTYKENSLEEEMSRSRQRIKEKEAEMLAEVEEKRQYLIQQAYEQGKQTAVQEAKENLRQQYEDIFRQANAYYEKANAHYQQIIEQTELLREEELVQRKEELIDFSLHIAKHILHKEIEEKPENLEHLFLETLKLIKYETKKIKIQIHPDSIEYLQRMQNQQYSPYLVFLPNLNLEPFDIIIETEREKLDNSIETQLKEIKEMLRSAFNA